MPTADVAPGHAPQGSCRAFSSPGRTRCRQGERLCGFAAALAARQAGDAVGANRWFERNRAACGPPGLYTEEHDVRRRQLRGNVLQGFVHALMLETAVTPGQVDPCR